MGEDAGWVEGCGWQSVGKVDLAEGTVLWFGDDGVVTPPPFLFDLKGRYNAGLDFAIAKGWLELLGRKRFVAVPSHARRPAVCRE